MLPSEKGRAQLLCLSKVAQLPHTRPSGLATHRSTGCRRGEGGAAVPGMGAAPAAGRCALEPSGLQPGGLPWWGGGGHFCGGTNQPQGVGVGTGRYAGSTGAVVEVEQESVEREPGWRAAVVEGPLTTPVMLLGAGSRSREQH